MAQRARVVLLAGDGVSNRAIGEKVGLHYNQVAVWRRRFGEFGIAGLDDEQRSGRPPVYDHDQVLTMVHLVTTDPPDARTRWTCELVAEAMNGRGVAISPSQVWRIFDALDLKPWQTTSWMTSKDPEFWAKAGDVCGLYLDPPANAVVWSVDEKTGIQAKSRINPTKPAVPGTGRRQEFEYRRHGTAVLFAGLNVHDGQVAGWVTDSSRSANFVEFLADLVAQTPAGNTRRRPPRQRGLPVSWLGGVDVNLSGDARPVADLGARTRVRQRSAQLRLFAAPFGTRHRILSVSTGVLAARGGGGCRCRSVGRGPGVTSPKSRSVGMGAGHAG